MEGNRIRARDALIWAIALCSICFIAGFIFGEIHAIGLFTKLGLKVLDAEGINLSISAESIASGIFKYQNHIGNLWGT